MTRYKILKCGANVLSTEAEKWEQISLERFLELTAQRGYYKKDTALKSIKGMGQIRTPWSFFKLSL